MIGEEKKNQLKDSLEELEGRIEQVMSTLNPLDSEELQMLQRLDRIKGNLSCVLREPRVFRADSEDNANTE